jgi:HSP20 family protein
MVDLIRRDPFRSVFAWPRWLEEWEDEFPTLTTSRGLRIHEDEKNIYVDAVVAGVSADDVKVDIEDGVITIRAEKKTEEKKKEEYKSSAYNYYYTCALSGGQWDKASAEVTNGVLELKIPKTEAARPRKITVKAKSK